MLEDAMRFYKRRMDRVIVFIAYVNSEPVGYCDGETYASIGGNGVGYIYTLAVKKKFQGGGIGTKLLYRVIGEMIKRGYRNIYLDSIEGLGKYYVDRGFRIVTRSFSYITMI